MGVGNNKFLGLFGAFGIVLAFFDGLIQMREWFLPIFGGVLVIALILGVRRFSEKYFRDLSFPLLKQFHMDFARNQWLLATVEVIRRTLLFLIFALSTCDVYRDCYENGQD